MNDRDDPVWKRALGCFLLPVILPFAIVIIPVLNALGLNKSRAGPEQLIEDLERFIEGNEGPWDLDDFCSVPLADEELEEIRARACDYLPPFSREDHQQLRKLVEEIRALQSTRA